jgi:outer membrane protein TolC
LFVPLALLLAGCSRSFYRQQADAETYPLVVERAFGPTSAVGNVDLTPPPQSRLSDPFNPDATPKPPDDPAAALFMARPGGFRGAKTWGKNGQADQIEPPGWEAGLGADEKGVLRLDQQRAAEVALLNSRELQTAREQLYLTALALTLNRFEFATQWFAGLSPSFTRVGASSLPTESNTLGVGGSAGFSRFLPAGGQLLANFANSFVWEYTGRTSAVNGSLSATLIQPLLRGFGRDVRLEGLTQAERNTLYAVRDFARFRKQFWVGVAVANGGYLDLLLQVQSLRNARENLVAQEENYARTEFDYQGNRRSVVDVDQAFQGLLQARQQILNAEVQLETALDAFKLRLGLPPRLAVELDDRPLERFVILDPEVDELRADLTAFELARNAEEEKLPDADTIRAAYAGLSKLAERTGGAIDSVDADLKRWKEQSERPLQPGEEKETRTRSAELYRRNAGVPEEGRKRLRQLAADMADHAKRVTEATRKEAWDLMVIGDRKGPEPKSGDMKRLVELLDDLTNAQTLARIYRIELPSVAADEAAAVAQAKANRLDLMNQKATVTDAWRKVIVAANALKSDLTVTSSLTLNSEPGAHNPLAFNNDFTRLSVGVQFDGPLNRLAERNVYRATLVAYQQARRDYMELSDRIEQQVRLNLRNLRQARLSFEIARQQLIAAARQVANERILRTAPPRVQQQGGGGDPTLRTLQALSQLNSARNNLAGSFIGYEQLRVQLLLNLEELQLDDRGLPTNASPPDDPGRAGAARPGAAGLDPPGPPPPPPPAK